MIGNRTLNSNDARGGVLVRLGQDREYWRSKGLAGKRDTVIHNGVDLECFRDRSESSQRAALRKQCGASEHDLLIGICAALRPEKAHGDLLRALAHLRERGYRPRC